MSQLYAMAPTPASTDPNAPAPNPMMSLMPLAVIAVLFYFLLIRPQQKQAKERDRLLKDLKEGDKVVLVSGVFATVTSSRTRQGPAPADRRRRAGQGHPRRRGAPARLSCKSKNGRARSGAPRSRCKGGRLDARSTRHRAHQGREVALEGDFGDVWVEGQVTNYRALTPPATATLA